MATCITCKGTNGSGKSMIIRLLKKRYDFTEDSYEYEGAKVKTTFIPALRLLALGHYRMGEIGPRGTRMWVGGCDTLQKAGIILALDDYWKRVMSVKHIYFEGQQLADTRNTYVDKMKLLNSLGKNKRKCYSLSIIPPVQTCIDRIMLRNQGKENKGDFKKLRQKHKSVIRQTEWLMTQQKRLGLEVVVYKNIGKRRELVDFFLETFGIKETK